MWKTDLQSLFCSGNISLTIPFIDVTVDIMRLIRVYYILYRYRYEHLRKETEFC